MQARQRAPGRPHRGQVLALPPLLHRLELLSHLGLGPLLRRVVGRQEATQLVPVGPGVPHRAARSRQRLQRRLERRRRPHHLVHAPQQLRPGQAQRLDLDHPAVPRRPLRTGQAQLLHRPLHERGADIDAHGHQHLVELGRGQLRPPVQQPPDRRQQLRRQLRRRLVRRPAVHQPVPPSGPVAPQTRPRSSLRRPAPPHRSRAVRPHRRKRAHRFAPRWRPGGPPRPVASPTAPLEAAGGCARGLHWGSAC